MTRSPLLAAALAALLAPAASAQVLRYTATGTVSGLQSPGGAWSGVQLGDPITVVLRVDASTPAAGPSDDRLYAGALLSAELDFGGVTSSAALTGSSVRVRNDASITPPDCSDALDVEALAAADYTLVRVSLEETAAACPSAFTSTQLPTTLALADFTTLRTITLQTGTASELVLGTLTGFTIAPDRPANDDCANAIALPPTFGTTPYDATGATTDGLTALFACDYGSFSDEQNHNDVWFTYTPAVGGCTYVSTYNLAGYDTRLTVYYGDACPAFPTDIIACVDDEVQPSAAPFEAGLDVNLVAGETYTIRLGTSFGIVPGAGALTIQPGPGADVHSGGANPGAPGCTTTPVNDDCANAIALPSTFAVTPYDALGATTDGADAFDFCDYGLFGDEQNHRDVWFTYTPAVGGCTYVSTLGLADYDTRLTIYDATTCPDDPLQILACADEEILPDTFPYEAGLDVDLQQGHTYLIRLGTYSEIDPADTGALRIAAGPVAVLSNGGQNPGAPGCVEFPSSCNGDGGDQMGCTSCPCGNDAPLGTVGGCLNGAGTSTRLDASGSASVSLPSGATTDLRFETSGGPALATSVLLSGDAVAPTSTANPCFGLDSGTQSVDRDGLRCAVQGLLRHGNRQTDAAGAVADSSGPSRVWGGEASPVAGIAGLSGFVAGQTRYFQVTHRDDPLLVCMRGLNTSQAVEVTFTP